MFCRCLKLHCFQRMDEDEQDRRNIRISHIKPYQGKSRPVNANSKEARRAPPDHSRIEIFQPNEFKKAALKPSPFERTREELRKVAWILFNPSRLCVQHAFPLKEATPENRPSGSRQQADDPAPRPSRPDRPAEPSRKAPEKKRKEPAAKESVSSKQDKSKELEEALKELERWKQQYNELKEETDAQQERRRQDSDKTNQRLKKRKETITKQAQELSTTKAQLDALKLSNDLKLEEVKALTEKVAKVILFEPPLPV